MMKDKLTLIGRVEAGIPAQPRTITPPLPKEATSKAMNRIFYKIALIALITGLSACSSLASMDFPGVYKIGIPQGNIITQEMVDQLRPGMTKRQVIFVMGTPLVRDPYHQDRWDYIYSYQPGGGVRGQEKISVVFIDDELASLSGDFMPTPIEDPSDPSDQPVANPLLDLIANPAADS